MQTFLYKHNLFSNISVQTYSVFKHICTNRICFSNIFLQTESVLQTFLYKRNLFSNIICFQTYLYKHNLFSNISVQTESVFQTYLYQQNLFYNVFLQTESFLKTFTNRICFSNISLQTWSVFKHICTNRICFATECLNFINVSFFIDGSVFKIVYWYISLPIIALLHFTIPDCKRARYVIFNFVMWKICQYFCHCDYMPLSLGNRVNISILYLLTGWLIGKMTNVEQNNVLDDNMYYDIVLYCDIMFGGTYVKSNKNIPTTLQRRMY